jgi:hypothetical protein
MGLVSENQRRAQRYDLRIDVEYALSGGDKKTSFTRNISLGGVFVDAPGLKVAFGTRAQLKLMVPTQKEPIEVGGTIRWIDEHGFGVQFDGLRARDVWALGKFFEQSSSS